MLKTLIKISLASVFSNLFNNQKKTGRGKKILYGILSVYLVATLLLFMATVFMSLAPSFIQNGMPWLYFAIVAILVMVINVFGSFSIAQSLIYKSKDNELLLSMPIKTSKILNARIFVLLAFNYIYSFFIFVPAGIVYLLNSGFSAVGFVLYLILSILLPLFTTTISLVFAWIMTLVTTKLKNKNLFSLIFAVVFLLGYMYLSFNLQNVISALTTNATQISASIKTYLSLFYCYGIAVANGNFLSALIFIAVCLIPFILAVFVLSKTFLKFTAEMNANTVGTKKTVEISQSSSLLSLFKKELARFVSLPTYILNASIGGILSIAVAVMLLVRGTDFLFNTMIPTSMELLMPVIIATIFAFMSGMSCSTVASVSLEGSNIQIIKSLPIRYKDFYNAKLLVNLVYGIPIVLIASLVSCFALKANVADALIIVLFPTVIQIFSAVFGLSIDMKKCKFNWTNPTYPVKQSINVLKQILIGIFASVLPLILCYVFKDYIDYHIFYYAVIVVFVVIDLMIYTNIIKSGKKYFEMMC